MVAIPSILSGNGRAIGRTGLAERFMAWLHADAAAASKPTRPPARRADFVEYAAMSREMHRL